MKEIGWEQRRYEIAKGILCVYLQEHPNDISDEIIQCAVGCADAILMGLLKKQSK